MNNLILNEKYSDTKNFFEVAKGDKIFYKNKNLIDLSSCSGVLILGHNSSVFKKGINKYLSKNISIFSHPNVHALKLSKNINYFFPNCKKFVYCNSGVESVLKSFRISRAINNKNIIVSVVGSWHGATDQGLVSQTDRELLQGPGPKQRSNSECPLEGGLPPVACCGA